MSSAKSRIGMPLAMVIGLAGIVGIVWVFATYFVAEERLGASIGREADGAMVLAICSDFDASKIYVSQRMVGGEWTDIWIANGRSQLKAGSTIPFGQAPEGMTNQTDREVLADHGEFSIQVIGTDNSLLAYFPWHDFSQMRPGTWFYTDGTAGDGPCEAPPR